MSQNQKHLATLNENEAYGKVNTRGNTYNNETYLRSEDKTQTAQNRTTEKNKEARARNPEYIEMFH